MQPRTVTKVPNLLGDERMSTINCDCGAKYDRIGSHKKGVLGFQCRNCMRHWRTCRVVNDQGQTELFYKYYECTCGSNSLNIAPKPKYCICEVGDLR
jgi:hypothetical protein